MHVQDKHAGLRGQWIDTWRPQKNNKEIGPNVEPELGVFPEKLYFGSDETAESFAIHHASWHKPCHLNFKKFKAEESK